MIHRDAMTIQLARHLSQPSYNSLCVAKRVLILLKVHPKICRELHKGCRAMIFSTESEWYQPQRGDERQHHGGCLATRRKFLSFHPIEDDDVSTSSFVPKWFFFLNWLNYLLLHKIKCLSWLIKLLGNAPVDRDTKAAAVLWETQILEGTRLSNYTYH